MADAIRPAESPDELDAYASAFSAVYPETPISGEVVRARAESRGDGRRYFVAWSGQDPVGTGFAGGTSTPGRANVLVTVRKQQRGRGLGSALLERSLGHARRLGATSAVGDLREEHLPWAERRGFQEFERAVEFILDLRGDEVPGGPPDGIRIVPLTDALAGGAFAVWAEGVADMPAVEALQARRETWRRSVAESPLVLVALDGDRVVGYAELSRRTADVLSHELTAVVRSHRRRGIARALKQTQVAWAAAHGARRLVTDTHLGNEATRRLNERLGYRQMPPLVAVRKDLS